MAGRLAEMAKLSMVACSQGQHGSPVTKNWDGQGQGDGSGHDVQGSQGPRGPTSGGLRWLTRGTRTSRVAEMVRLTKKVITIDQQPGQQG